MAISQRTNSVRQGRGRRHTRLITFLCTFVLVGGGCGLVSDEPSLSTTPLAIVEADRPSVSLLSHPATTYETHWPTQVAPNDIAANGLNGQMAVVDAGHETIEILSQDGTHHSFRGGFVDPRCAAFLADGVLLVGDAATGSVHGFDETGIVVVSLGQGVGEFTAPNDITIDPVTGRIYVVDSAQSVVRVYLSSGAFAFEFGAEELTFPIAIAVSTDLGEVFVADFAQRKIQVFNAEHGHWVRGFGVGGSGEGEISFLGGLEIDQDNRLYVVEALGGFVQLFDVHGGYIGRIGEHGSGPGQLRNPKTVAIDSADRLLVGSYADREIEVWAFAESQSPPDEPLHVTIEASPTRLGTEQPVITVVLTTDQFDVALINGDSIRLNGSEVDRLMPGHTGPRRFIPRFMRGLRNVDTIHLGWGRSQRRFHFRTADILQASPFDAEERTTLALTGVTTDGRSFEGSFEVTITSEPEREGQR